MIDTFKTVEDILEGLNFFDFSFFILGFSTFFTLMFFIKDLFDKTYEYKFVNGVLAASILIYVVDGFEPFSMGKGMRSLIRKCLEKIKWNWLKLKSFDELFKKGQNLAVENMKKTMSEATNDNLLRQLSLSVHKKIAYSSMLIENHRKDDSVTYYMPLCSLGLFVKDSVLGNLNAM